MAKYRAGVIGCGGIGNQHAAGFVGLNNVELVAGCDISEAALERFKGKWSETWPGLKCYSDYREMLAMEGLDIVTIATLDDQHAEPVIACADAEVRGIFCEKPMATSLADADRMMAAIERSGTLLSIDHTRRWQPLWRHLKEDVLPSGVIGDIQYLVGTLGGARGSLFRNGTHMVDALCYLADSEPEWVFAELEAGYENYTEYRGDGGIDPTLEPSASGYIHFKNGVRGFYTGTSKTTPDPKWKVEIVGSTGVVLITADAVLQKAGKVEPIAVPSWPVTGIAAGVQELVKLVAEGGEPVSPAKAAHQVVEVMVGFLVSQKRDNSKVPIPVPRDWVE